MTPHLELTTAPSDADLAAIGAGLAAFNEADVGASGRMPLVIVLRGGADAVLGGLSGYTAWGWLYVQWLWLSDPLRGHGWAGRMLTQAEAEARARGCHGAYIDTFSPVALRAYTHAGYVPFGSLPEFPKGRTRVFLSKSLTL